ncbi:hypothetical protein AAFF_G00349590 [Aldrovandia affinis]|uniref:Protein phosphatase methylesterase-1 n=1 Tax=Aldrovandia affinis TaxID=143900 RepID=A0AAD7WNX1_9TELE|nr:hypothetical protein AAFF_G00349590 [Aldrovandia affinis]
MQGKFMMQVLPPCGHAVHEDMPDKVAEALANFMIRHKFAEARGDSERPENSTVPVNAFHNGNSFFT